MKRVRCGSADEGALRRETDIYARLQYLDCEHVLQIIEVLRDGDHLTLVTEFADGGDLAHHVQTRGSPGLPARDALTIALEIASGLEELHAAHIVHRDVKPENVLRAGARWKVADFGIAKNRDNAAPGRTFQQAGTLGYASPEQLEGAEAHPSADIYSFGKVLAFLLTGNRDIDGIRPELEELRALARRCTAYEPGARLTVSEVIQILARLRTGSG